MRWRAIDRTILCGDECSEEGATDSLDPTKYVSRRREKALVVPSSVSPTDVVYMYLEVQDCSMHFKCIRNK